MRELTCSRSSSVRSGRLWCAALLCLGGFAGPPVVAQPAADLAGVLARLDRLEKQNEALQAEVQSLRQELAAAHVTPAGNAPALAETVAIQSQRLEEQEQTKVETVQKFPLRLGGMVLFNSYFNSRHNGGTVSYPIAVPPAGRQTAGANFRQSQFSLNYDGPQTVGGGKVRGALVVDLYSPATSYDAPPGITYNAPGVRLRTGFVAVDWGSRSVLVGREKPLIAPLDPDSLAQVGEPALSGAGNLWLWQSQVRFEQRVKASNRDLFKLQAALYATSENSARVPDEFAATLSRNRPGWQGRAEWSHTWGETLRVQLAPGFHYSATHVAGTSVPSRAFSFDGLAQLGRQWEFKGAFFTGENLANMGTLGQSFTIFPSGAVRSVHSTGGWFQLAWSPTERLSFHLFRGEQRDRPSDLLDGISKNQSYGGNLFFRLAPNVILSLEAAQFRTSYLAIGTPIRNRYDVALAYLF